MTITTAVGPFPATATRTVRRDGVELAVYECGNPEGVPVLLIHGWPDTHLLWSRVAALLGGRHRVIAFDNRGRAAVPRRPQSRPIGSRSSRPTSARSSPRSRPANGCTSSGTTGGR